MKKRLMSTASAVFLSIGSYAYPGLFDAYRNKLMRLKDIQQTNERLELRLKDIQQTNERLESLNKNQAFLGENLSVYFRFLEGDKNTNGNIEYENTAYQFDENDVFVSKAHLNFNLGGRGTIISQDLCISSDISEYYLAKKREHSQLFDRAKKDKNYMGLLLCKRLPIIWVNHNDDSIKFNDIPTSQEALAAYEHIKKCQHNYKSGSLARRSCIEDFNRLIDKVH